MVSIRDDVNIDIDQACRCSKVAAITILQLSFHMPNAPTSHSVRVVLVMPCGAVTRSSTTLSSPMVVSGIEHIADSNVRISFAQFECAGVHATRYSEGIAKAEARRSFR